MKRIAIVSLPLILSACVSSDYVTDVSSESYREDYKTAAMQEPIMAEQDMGNGMMEEATMTVKPMNNKAKPAVAIVAPTEKQKAMSSRYGFTIQVVAVGTQTKVDKFARKLPKNGEPIWENYKVVNGTKWYTILYGDYATRMDAKKAIAKLPNELQDMKPFVKSIDAIKKSQYPTLNKLN
ncbi:SPOR domain-containing protein [Vibrio sp. OCN044]|uniref:SPOR domain-containing protein n=1 Tax=Vibrio tetraodonis subsp. pristinus TaxID=2695891 RepID=A0A6L8LRQ8_9VIBR|nr:SPOR domain-containing protein [Vibrio tetraodonis]MYM58718.1 SPOR domain-containing protein [Vibrio tetraodonis subsp. pristinus]